MSADVRTSSFCQGGGCVEVRFLTNGYVILASSRPGARAHSFVVTNDEWDAFIAGAKNGEFDRAGGDPMSGLRESLDRLQARADGHDVPFTVLDASYVWGELVRLRALAAGVSGVQVAELVEAVEVVSGWVSPEAPAHVVGRVEAAVAAVRDGCRCPRRHRASCPAVQALLAALNEGQRGRLPASIADAAADSVPRAPVEALLGALEQPYCSLNPYIAAVRRHLDGDT